MSAVDFQYASECRNRKNCPRSKAFANGSGRPGNVFLEQRSLPGSHCRHRNDGSRIGGGDGDACAQTEVGIGRAKNYGHAQSQQHRPKRKFLHFCMLRDVWLMFFGGLDRIGRALIAH